MEAYLLDWANLLLRWLHVIVAIAWIGASFYFVFLDASLVSPKGENPDRVAGELWAVHGGGFYHARKFMGAPPSIGGHLHWFYWESYMTWISGFVLLAVSYLWNPSGYLVDPSVASWTNTQAVLLVLAYLVGFWLVYEAICRLAGRPGQGDRAVALGVSLAVIAAAWLTLHTFSGRAAFLLTGAMMATVMTTNVLFWIIPGQRRMVACLQAGQPVDPLPGLVGKQRSVHNTYFTLPVVFTMLSNHYGFVTQHSQKFWLLLLIMLAGALIRVFFVRRHGHRLGKHSHPWPYAAAGGVALIATIAIAAPKPNSASSIAPQGPQADIQTIQTIASKHCLQCHGAAVQLKNVRLDSPEELKRHALSVYQQVVVQKAMPMSNVTQMTDAERAAVASWFKAGAPTQ